MDRPHSSLTSSSMSTWERILGTLSELAPVVTPMDLYDLAKDVMNRHAQVAIPEPPLPR
jgi:hypothetical protein